MNQDPRWCARLRARPDPPPGPPPPPLPQPAGPGDEGCEVCGSGNTYWRNCKLVCRDCRQIVKSCADL